MSKRRSKKSKSSPIAAASTRAWIGRTKLRALATVAAIVLVTVATIMLAGAPWIPVVGVAFAAACVSVSKLTTRLVNPTCLDCGCDLSGQPIGVQGIICHDCGAVNSPGLVQLAQMGEPPAHDDTDRA